MALAATTIHEVMTTGSDTLNGGMFDPGQTAGMFTDGAATVANTASPVFTSASYNFVAGDVGAWVFIASGTNWTPGWYKIASVAANAATLNATIGQATIKFPCIPTTVVGCATVASPTGATWSIDYSQQAAAQFTYTDLASVGAGLLVSSVAKPFAKQQVGNSLVITGGTNFTTGRYVIASVAAGVATVVGAANITTGAGVNGTGGQGGCFATIGIVGAHAVSNNTIFIKTASYSTTSASTNISGGCFSGTGNLSILGYDTVRGDLDPITATGTRPTITASGISTFTLLTGSGVCVVRNLILDGASLTLSRGITFNASHIDNIWGKNFTNSAFNGSATMYRCAATNCINAAAYGTGATIACMASGCNITPFASGGLYINCLSYNNTGATTDGFFYSGAGGLAFGCTAYGNGRDGFRLTGNGNMVASCIAEGNAGVGFIQSYTVVNCAAYNNTGGAFSAPVDTIQYVISMIIGLSSFFTNAAGADFSLNNTANAGALVRGIGYPGVFQTGGTGYRDIGALQHQDAAVVGGGSVFSSQGGVIT